MAKNEAHNEAQPTQTTLERKPESGITRITKEALLKSIGGRHYNGEAFEYKYPDGLPDVAKSQYARELEFYCTHMACIDAVHFSPDASDMLKVWWQAHQEDPSLGWEVWLALDEADVIDMQVLFAQTKHQVERPGATDFLAKLRRKSTNGS